MRRAPPCSASPRPPCTANSGWPKLGYTANSRRRPRSSLPMTPQSDFRSWELLETLFHQAAELEPPQRAAFLDSACNGNDDLRRELESLLATADRTLQFLREPVLQTIS